MIINGLQKVISEVEMAQKETGRVQCFEDAVDFTFGKLKEIMVAKQRDYGPQNILNGKEVGVVIRGNDKMARLMNLYGINDGTFTPKPAANESIEDTWSDLANYAAIALMLRWGIFNRPLRDQPAPQTTKDK